MLSGDPGLLTLFCYFLALFLGGQHLSGSTGSRLKDLCVSCPYCVHCASSVHSIWIPLQVTVHGDGFKEWEATIPTQEGATAADVLKELENAVSFELRSLDLMKQTVVVPNSALWRDISTHLTHGYYLFAHGTHPPNFFARQAVCLQLCNLHHKTATQLYYMHSISAARCTAGSRVYQHNSRINSGTLLSCLCTGYRSQQPISSVLCSSRSNILLAIRREGKEDSHKAMSDHPGLH